jgi:hypothetical protein
MMKQLNFFPYYEEYLDSHIKTTTFRLDNSKSFKEGDEAMITIGWNEDGAMKLHPAKITKVYRKHISELNEFDFEGESPDCKSPEATKLVLSCIYKTVLKNDDEIFVIKFDHLSNRT